MITLMLLLALITGCAAAPRPAPRLTDEQRHAKYDELGDQLAAIPYVFSWGLDSRQDKLEIAVGTLEARRAVEKAAAAVGLPLDAVLIHQPIPALSEAAPFAGCQSTTQKPPGENTGLRLTPAAMQTGQPFQLKVTAGGDQIMRGVDSYLECWDGQGWSTRYLLMVGFGAEDAKPTARIYGAGAVIVTLGLIGPGPEDLILPPDMPPGWYRIHKQVSVGNQQQTLTAMFQLH
jgi:hypothetical protein